ncbi:hypothetical protein T4B_2145 [Trichinella pseudospiralis]|uniref:Uncharacterized protein n=1 Tax=Trichinella pseudospiralis TaxID=6337 RepID=A0A0V1JJJ2_TRIPS|nr:hypothetical protein T4B_2145 [Trichinella pseudospiralis]
MFGCLFAIRRSQIHLPYPLNFISVSVEDFEFKYFYPVHCGATLVRAALIRRCCTASSLTSVKHLLQMLYV